MITLEFSPLNVEMLTYIALERWDRQFNVATKTCVGVNVRLVHKLSNASRIIFWRCLPKNMRFALDTQNVFAAKFFDQKAVNEKRFFCQETFGNDQAWELKKAFRIFCLSICQNTCHPKTQHRASRRWFCLIFTLHRRIYAKMKLCIALLCDDWKRFLYKEDKRPNRKSGEWETSILCFVSLPFLFPYFRAHIKMSDNKKCTCGCRPVCVECEVNQQELTIHGQECLFFVNLLTTERSLKEVGNYIQEAKLQQDRSKRNLENISPENWNIFCTWKLKQFFGIKRIDLKRQTWICDLATNKKSAEQSLTSCDTS